jgi:hypothetical protein
MRYVWLIGLLIACGAAIAMIVLPPEDFIVPCFVALILGLALFGAGVFLRIQKHEVSIGTAMKRFAESNGGAFQEALPVDELPASISLFHGGERQRCTHVIALECAGRSCLLFRFECYYRGTGRTRVGAWSDYYVAYAPRALPGVADYQVQSRFSPTGPLILVVVVSLLATACSLPNYVATGSAASLLLSLLLPASFLVFGSFVVLVFWLNSRPAPAPDFLHKPILARFSRQGLCAQCADGNLAVWTERTMERLWRTGWNRSFRPVKEWVAEELQGLLEAAGLILSRAGPPEGEKSDGAKPGLPDGQS